MNELKQAVHLQLQKGREHAIHGKLLAQRLGERDTRNIRLCIIELVPVLSDSAHGYWIAESPAEIDKAARTLKDYGISAITHRRDLLRCKKRMEIPLPVTDNGQVRMF